MNDDNTPTYDQHADIGEKLDFFNWRLGLLDTRIEELFRMMHSVGQMTTNVDAFCQEVRATVDGMRKNPMMRAMVPPMQNSSPLIVPGK